MTNQQHIDAVLRKLEADHGTDRIYDFFSALHDGIVLGHSSSPDDNPHQPNEQPSHAFYELGARTAERILATLGRPS